MIKIEGCNVCGVFLTKISILLPIYIFAIFVLILTGAAITYGLGHNGGNFNHPITTFFDAIYFTVITISTVGYGDITPITEVSKLFVILLLFIGLGIFASTITFISGEIMNNRLQNLSGRISNTERKFLRKHTILVGYNSTNNIIAKMLKEKAKRFIIVSPDKIVVDQLKEDGYRAYVTDVTSEIDMKQLNLEKADHIIIDLREDSLTVYVSILIRNLLKDLHTDIDIVVETRDVEKHLKSIGITNTINPAAIAAKSIVDTHFID